MRVLVTGGAGFIGSNIVDRYLEAGHEVAVLDDLSTGKRENLNSKATFFQTDLRDLSLTKLIADFKPEIITHLAAQIDVRKSVADPINNAEINELGTLNLLNAARDAKVNKIIFSSTGGALYGEVKGSSGAAEDHPMEPISPYAITKRSVEMYLHAYFQLYGLKYTVLRYGNVYGPRQDPLGGGGGIAIFFGKLMKKEVPTIYGDGEQLRDYIYVAEVADVNLIALTKGDNRVFNVGTGEGTSVNQLYAILKELFKFDQEAVYLPSRAGELFRSVLDCRLAKNELGWQANCDIKEGLRRTVAWYYA